MKARYQLLHTRVKRQEYNYTLAVLSSVFQTQEEMMKYLKRIVARISRI